jgi:hypothetical protein
VQAHLQALAVLFMQYTGENKGKTPPDEATFKKFISGLPKERLMGNTVEEIFVSPRDSQPYVVLYGAATSSGVGGPPMPGSPPGAPGSSGPSIVAHEKTGAGGKRFVATSLGGVEEVDEAKFQSMLPKK